MKFGLIAGNGEFPFMVVDGARQSGVPLVVAAIPRRPIPRWTSPRTHEIDCI